MTMPLIRADQISPHGAMVILTLLGTGLVLAMVIIAAIVAAFAVWDWWRHR